MYFEILTDMPQNVHKRKASGRTDHPTCMSLFIVSVMADSFSHDEACIIYQEEIRKH